MKTSIVLLGVMIRRALGLSGPPPATSGNAQLTQIADCGIEFGNFAGWTLVGGDGVDRSVSKL
jgi:hypothetical protein